MIDGLLVWVLGPVTAVFVGVVLALAGLILLVWVGMRYLENDPLERIDRWKR